MDDPRTNAAEAITLALCAAWPVEIGSDLVFAEQVGRIAADAVLLAEPDRPMIGYKIGYKIGDKLYAPEDVRIVRLSPRFPDGVPGENGDTWCCATCKKLAEEGL